jgi:RNA polymerase sigma-70 factor (ECF subfamily)
LQGSKQSQVLIIEQQLILAAQNNPARFAPLYDKYHRQIFLFIFKRVKNEDLAGDITSRVFLKALLNIKKFKQFSNVLNIISEIILLQVV